jgi:hypothetical protein
MVHDRERGIGLIGAYQGELTPEVLDRWIADVHEPFRGRGQAVSKLVIATSAITPALRSAAQIRGVDVERLIDYQRVLDTAGYSEKLRERLARDREYPSGYYLEQRMTVWTPVASSRERVERGADWLTARLLEREGAFVLVLGPAGVGKTFLMREVARRLGKQQAITPLLVELRDLERAHTIEELAATQFTRFGVPWHPRAFRCDLEEGRLALLFDGFDELALRVRAAAIPAHFERIYGAAVDRARIVVSSRTEHFLSSGHVADLMTPSSTSSSPTTSRHTSAADSAMPPARRGSHAWPASMIWWVSRATRACWASSWTSPTTGWPRRRGWATRTPPTRCTSSSSTMPG